MNDKVKEAQEAQIAWDDLAEKKMNDNTVFSAYSYTKGISDYKQALKAEILKSIEQDEFVISNQKGYHPNDILQAKRIAGTARRIIELIDTCKP